MEEKAPEVNGKADGGEEAVNGRAKEVEVPEGSDSGVEVNGSAMGGVEGDVTPAASCDSSLVSCCYSSEDLVSNTLQLLDELSLEAGDGTSEGGSESSSVAGYHKPRLSASNGVRKKCSLVRTPSTNRPSPPPNYSSRSRTPNCRERTPSGRAPSLTRSAPAGKSLHPSRALQIPTTPRTHRDTSESSTSRKTVSRVPSLSRSKANNNSSPTDDGRWPSTLNKSAQKPRPVVDKKNSLMTSSVTSVESKSSALDKYATLPRRRRRSAENLTQSEPLSSREPSLNRTASLRKKQNPMTSSFTPSPNPKTMPPYPRKSRTLKTRIFHEISVQTALTGTDLEGGLAGSLLKDIHSRVETRNCGVQVSEYYNFVGQEQTL